MIMDCRRRRFGALAAAGWAAEYAKGTARALFLDAVAHRPADDANAEDER